MSRQDRGPGAPARRGAEFCFELANSRTRAPTRPRCVFVFGAVTWGAGRAGGPPCRWTPLSLKAWLLEDLYEDCRAQSLDPAKCSPETLQRGSDRWAKCPSLASVSKSAASVRNAAMIDPMS